MANHTVWKNPSLFDNFVPLKDPQATEILSDRETQNVLLCLVLLFLHVYLEHFWLDWEDNKEQYLLRDLFTRALPAITNHPNRTSTKHKNSGQSSGLWLWIQLDEGQFAPQLFTSKKFPHFSRRFSDVESSWKGSHLIYNKTRKFQQVFDQGKKNIRLQYLLQFWEINLCFFWCSETKICNFWSKQQKFPEFIICWSYSTHENSAIISLEFRESAKEPNAGFNCSTQSEKYINRTYIRCSPKRGDESETKTN